MIRATRPYIQIQRTFRWRHWSHDLLSLEKHVATRRGPPRSGSIQSRLGLETDETGDKFWAVKETVRASDPRLQEVVGHGAYTIWLGCLCQVQKAKLALGPRKYTAMRLTHLGPRGLATSPFLIRCNYTRNLDEERLGVPTRKTKPHEDTRTNSVSRFMPSVQPTKYQWMI